MHYKKQLSQGICLALLVTVASASLAQVYRWKGADGKFRYSDKPRAGAVLIMEAKPAVIEALSTPGGYLKVGDGATSISSNKEQLEGAYIEDSEVPEENNPLETEKKSSSIRTVSPMSEADQNRLRELSRKHKKCASSRNRLNKLKLQLKQRKDAPAKTLEYLNRSIVKHNATVEKNCG